MTRAASPAASPLQVGLAWSVHLLTASGAVVAVLALLAAAGGDLREAGLWMLVALAIDSVDGTLARRARVTEVLPGIDGRRLDDIVDYLNYAVVPALFLVWGGLLPHWIFAALPVAASAYGFSQTEAKTEDHFFLGFPSYWNVVALYLWQLALSPGVAALWIVGLSAAVFVPIKYIHPSHMTRLAAVTNLGATVWILVMAAAIAWPARTAGWPLVELSLLYPAWYVGLSLWLGGLRPRLRGEA
jgi:phosphatidylcholine synthase